MVDCEICCEKFNLQNHKKVECAFCDYKSCRTCVQRYLTSTINDPHCLSCKKEWNREFVDANCTKTFCNKELKQHRENILLEREKSFLPQAQEDCRRRKQAIEIQKQIITLQENIKNQRLMIDTLEHNRLVLLQGNDIDNTDDEAGPSEKKTFVRKCPVENCRGFLSTKWKCELCENKICSKCNEIKNTEDHTCDPNNVQTVNLLKKDTKGCPSCGTLINKSSGCSQMWCPNCHTAFNWNTLKIEKGVIHNPHFYEFQRRNGRVEGANRNIGDIPCGGLPDMVEINTFFDKKPPPAVHRYGYYRGSQRPAELNLDQVQIYDIHRLINHLENHEFRWEFRNGVLNVNEGDLRELRIKYLMNEIDENTWKKNLQQSEKKLSKLRDVYNILRMFSITSSDLLRQLVIKDISIQDCIVEVTALRDYVNNQLYTIKSRYNCANINTIRDSWDYNYRR